VYRDRYVATDGKRLAAIEGPALPSDPVDPHASSAGVNSSPIIVPVHRAWSLKTARKWWTGAATIYHNVDKHCLSVLWDDGRRLDLRLIDATYPNWPQVVPPTEAPAVTDLTPLADALRTWNAAESTVTLSPDGGARFRCGDRAGEATAPTTTFVDATPDQVFQVDFLADLIDAGFTALEWGRAHPDPLSRRGNTMPGPATAVGISPRDVAVVMPMVDV
jgi:hypothetical protein